MKKYRAFISLFIVLILPLLVYGFLKLVSVQNYRPIETISEKIPNPGGSPDSVFKSIGDFSLITQLGEPFTRDSLKGKIWVVNLFYGRCGEACERIHSKFSKLQSDYKDDPDVRLLSVTIDPAHDTLPVLQAYAKSMEATPYRWYFLTGDAAQVNKFITEDLDYKPADATDIANQVLRESTLRLVDWNGLFRGEYYEGTEEDKVVRMAQHMVLLQKEMQTAKAHNEILP